MSALVSRNECLHVLGESTASNTWRLIRFTCCPTRQMKNFAVTTLRRSLTDRQTSAKPLRRGSPRGMLGGCLPRTGRHKGVGSAPVAVAFGCRDSRVKLSLTAVRIRRRIQRHVRKWFGSGALDRIGWLLDVFSLEMMQPRDHAAASRPSITAC
jgi:hypothetical protein